MVEDEGKCYNQEFNENYLNQMPPGLKGPKVYVKKQNVHGRLQKTSENSLNL